MSRAILKSFTPVLCTCRIAFTKAENIPVDIVCQYDARLAPQCSHFAFLGFSVSIFFSFHYILRLSKTQITCLFVAVEPCMSEITCDPLRVWTTEPAITIVVEHVVQLISIHGGNHKLDKYQLTIYLDLSNLQLSRPF